MQFQRLRLSGFKSFVEPTEFRIESGLTGVVGPNGCGKSNLLEALRWVMGANSAKAMRAGGMDDVIFAGSGGRPSRNHADVALTIDNADRTAPAQFNDQGTIEVVRRIDRGAGSTYRINGREARARDVQLLFADASTGANSPALVRQGQISELISAKPQNRRLILEEAAGVSGLHSRRHEAELRLRAAESNLARLDDIGRELETALGRLKREARQAERYRRLAAEIRVLQSAALHARWSEAKGAAEQADAEAGQAARAAESAGVQAARASAAALAAGEAIKPLREEEMKAAAVMGHLAIEKDRLEREAQQARTDLDRLAQEVQRIDADRARETQIVEEAAAALARLEADIARLQAATAEAPERLPALEAAWAAAEGERAGREAELERLASEAAAGEARRAAFAQRLQEAEARLGRSQRAMAAAEADREALGAAAAPEVAAARQAFERAAAALGEARRTLEAAETAQADAVVGERASRDQARKLEDRLGRLKTEARGLAQLAPPPAKGGYARVLDSVNPDPGFETALAAALGDDLDAALDSRAAAYWGGAEREPPQWPPGVTPLAERVKAPPALAARLAYIGLVEAKDGESLAKTLPPGARLVSTAGDLWRWDGFVARAEAPRPAAARLAQKARLAVLETEIDALAPAAAEATRRARESAAALQRAEEGLRAARRAPQDAERILGAAREVVERLGREQARQEARIQSLNDTVAHFDAERTAAEAALSDVRAEAAALPPAEDLTPGLDAIRAACGEAREAAAAARAAFEAERRECDGRAERLARLGRDREDGARRAAVAAGRVVELAADRLRVDKALALARDVAPAVQAKAAALLDALAAAEARRSKAADALAAAESALALADGASRAADLAAGEAREARAAQVARAQGAAERLVEAAAAIWSALQLEPDALARRLAEEATAVPADLSGVEAHLTALTRDLDAVGPVNLRAEDEAKEYAARLNTLRTEQADLSGAVKRLREGIETLNGEGRERLLAAFEVINGHFQMLFQTLFGGGQAELRLIESDDPLEAGLEIFACPPGKRLSSMSLMSGGEQALTAAALIFGVFLANPAPICVLDEVDAPLDDANVDRFCNMLNEMRERTDTRFIAITHNPVTMARMDRLFGVTMAERGVSQLVSVDLQTAEALAAE